MALCGKWLASHPRHPLTAFLSGFESVPYRVQGFLRSRAELLGGSYEPFCFIPQAARSFPVGKGGRGGDECAVSAPGDDDACRFEFPVGAGDRSGCEIEVGGELSDGR